MASKNLTSANAIITLAVDTLYPTPVRLQKFTADSSFTQDVYEVVETSFGVDGNLDAGVIYNPVPITIHFQPTSLNLDMITDVQVAQLANRTVYVCTMKIVLPAVGRQYDLNRGFLLSAKMSPDGARILQPQTAQFRFESMTVSTFTPA